MIRHGARKVSRKNPRNSFFFTSVIVNLIENFWDSASCGNASETLLRCARKSSSTEFNCLENFLTLIFTLGAYLCEIRPELHRPLRGVVDDMERGYNAAQFLEKGVLVPFGNRFVKEGWLNFYAL